MSQDNMFENSEWEPSGNYGSNFNNFDSSAVEEAKRTFSRFSLALFIFILVANVTVLGISLIMLLSMGTLEYEAFLDNNPIIEMLLSTLPMYLLAFPIFYLIVRKLPSRAREKKKLPALELFYLFLVAEAFMTVGNLLGQTISNSIGSIFGFKVSNGTAELVLKTPIWLIFLLVVIVAPIIEEFIFRKLMIDKLSRFGDKVAIVTSAVAFALFHGNFYQFFYAAFLGLLLGYLYCKSGKMRYTVAFHMIINLLGSVVIIPLIKYEEILLTGTLPETGSALREFVIAAIAVGSYTVIQYAMIIAGLIIFFRALKYRLINLNPTAEIKIPEGRTASTVLGNVGTVLFLVLSVIILAVRLFLG